VVNEGESPIYDTNTDPFGKRIRDRINNKTLWRNITLDIFAILLFSILYIHYKDPISLMGIILFLFLSAPSLTAIPRKRKGVQIYKNKLVYEGYTYDFTKVSSIYWGIPKVLNGTSRRYSYAYVKLKPEYGYSRTYICLELFGDPAKVLAALHAADVTLIEDIPRNISIADVVTQSKKERQDYLRNQKNMVDW